jgi:hypothetical protein
MPIVRLQPESVRRIFGEKGERLTGSLIERSDLGVSASVSKEFVIGGEQAADEQASRLQQEIETYRDLLQRIKKLETELIDTRKQRLLENPDDLRSLGKWGQFARQFRANQDAVNADIEKLKDMGAKLRLVAANGDLGVMFLATASSNQQEFSKVSSIYSESVLGVLDFINELETKLSAVKPIQSAEIPKLPTEASPRTWKDNTGKFSVEATLVEVLDKEIVLEKADGTRINVSIERLCEEDRKLVEKARDKQ